MLNKNFKTYGLTSKINIGDLEKQTNKVIKNIVQGGNTLVDNTMDDIEVIYDSLSDCAAQLDKVRVRVSNRAIEYYTAINRTLIDASLIPVDLILEVFYTIAPQLERDPNPRLFKLLNPKQAVWDNEAPQLELVINSSIFDENRKSYFFVHGKNYAASGNEAFESMFKPFEKAVGLFNDTRDNCDNCDVFILSYDTKLTDELETIITQGFATVLGSAITGNAPVLYLAVLWKELERRAEIAGDYFLDLIANTPQIDKPYFLFSHSLGCYVAAHMGNRFYSAYPNAGQLFRGWDCMAAAIPSNSFTETGIFPRAIRLIGDEPTLNVLYSYLDNTLSTAYILANGITAMGQTGPGIVPRVVKSVNTTKLSREVHTIPGGYFDLVAEIIR